jgi:AmmeMemoRadiSam system protein A
VRTRGPVLAKWAREHLRATLGGPAAHRPDEGWCREPAATFVSLHWTTGELQGCIGCLQPARAIVDDVASHVVSAALHDPRTEPIMIDDIDRLDLEISLLSALQRIDFADIRPGVDGLVLEHLGARATLLPVMWQQLPDIATFLAALKQKAGLPRDFESPALELSRYTTDHYFDPAPIRST